MAELAGVIRGSGKGLGVIVQTMQGLSRRLIPNLATKIMGRLGSHDDYARLGADLAMNLMQVEWARRKLKPGMFVVQVAEGDWREPFIISVPLIKTRALVSDEDATRSVRPLEGLKTVPATEFAAWEPDHIVRLATPDQRAAEEEDPAAAFGAELHTETSQEERAARVPEVSKELLDYVAAVACAPLQSCTERDHELGIGASKGHRIRGALVERGLVRLVAVNPGGRGRRFQLLEFTDDGRTLLTAYGIPLPHGHGRGGITHQWWVRTIVDWLTGQGLTVSIEDDSHGARVDLTASTSDGRILAIEIETSPGHEVKNIRKDIAAGFRTVICLVENRTAIGAVQNRLEGTPLSASAEVDIRVGEVRRYAQILRDAIEPGS
jgi:hypothetical protein